MAMIKYDDEKDLQRRICEILNKGGYHFRKEKDTYFCDIVDQTINAFGEVKVNGKFAPQQLLYGIAKENVQARYLILANEFELRVYECPEMDVISKFARDISQDFSRNPSSIVEMHHVEEAFKILGTQSLIYTYKGDFRIDEKHPCIFLDDNNYEYFQIVLAKYRINPADFINKFAKTWVNKSRLFIKNDGVTIFDQESGNEVKANRKITNDFDRMLIRSTRVKPENIEKIIHKIDTLAPVDIRRKRGKYWSNLEVSDIVTEVIREIVNPTFVLEPFVGGGSLVRDMIGDIKGVVNDIDGSMVDLLEKEWEGYGWIFHRKNFLTTPIGEVSRTWGLPEQTERFLVYTNPPFGTASAPKTSSKKDEVKNSRKNEIQYGHNAADSKYFGDTYGRGDLCIPSIAHMIELVKRRGDGYLAFFSPFGVMLGRNRFNKLLKALLKDFEFLYGEVFSGKMFNGVSKNKAISFTVWKYNSGCHASQEDTWFLYGGERYETKVLPLLKDGWNYDTRKYVRGEIAAQVNYSFGSMIPKVLHLQITKGGSELLPQNVRIPLGIGELPDELVYGLWSIAVGRKSNIMDAPNYPVIFDNCYTHLPDFTDERAVQVLAYIALYTIIFELKNNYCEGKIGFVGMNRVFAFGGERLTKGVMMLFDDHGSQCIGKLETISSVFEKLKNGMDPDEIDKDLRMYMREEVQERLNEIGYWKYLPVPDISDEKEEIEEE